MQVYIPDVDIGVVGNAVCFKVTLGIEGNLGIADQLDVAASLVERQVGCVVGAVGGHFAVERDAVGNADGVAHLGIDEGGHEVQLLRRGLHLQVGFHAAELCDIVDGSLDGGVQGCGEVDVDARQIQVLHIPVCRTSDDERLVREVLCELLGQFAGYCKDVLLTYLCEEAHLEDTWLLLVEGVEVHVCFEHDVRVGCLQRHQGHADVVVGGVEVEATCQFRDLQSALIRQHRLSDEE